jgi:hypothetical protein
LAVLDVEDYGMAAQFVYGAFEADSGAGGVFVEKHAHRSSPQVRLQVFMQSVALMLEVLGPLEYEEIFFQGEIPKGYEMLGHSF